MKTIAINTLFWLYFVLVLAGLVSYIMWLISLENYDTTFELIVLILIGMIFTLSLYLFYAYDTIACPGVFIFFGFVLVMVYTFLNARQEQSKINRRAAYILGILSFIPVMITVVINYLDKPLLPPVNLE
jgi:CDP-diglyceride synthetase